MGRESSDVRNVFAKATSAIANDIMLFSFDFQEYKLIQRGMRRGYCSSAFVHDRFVARN